MLDKFPSEVLDLILQCPETSYCVINLWLCGNGILNSKLAYGGCTKVRILDRRIFSTSRWPQVLGGLLQLKELVIHHCRALWTSKDLEDGLLMLNRDLETLGLGDPDLEQQKENTFDDEPEQKPVSGVLNKVFDNMAFHFPLLKSLVIAQPYSDICRPINFSKLPPNLTDFGYYDMTHHGYSPLILNDLPRTLTSLSFAFKFDVASFEHQLADLPPSLTEFLVPFGDWIGIPFMNYDKWLSNVQLLPQSLRSFPVSLPLQEPTLLFHFPPYLHTLILPSKWDLANDPNFWSLNSLFFLKHLQARIDFRKAIFDCLPRSLESLCMTVVSYMPYPTFTQLVSATEDDFTFPPSLTDLEIECPMDDSRWLLQRLPTTLKRLCFCPLIHSNPLKAVPEKSEGISYPSSLIALHLRTSYNTTYYQFIDSQLEALPHSITDLRGIEMCPNSRFGLLPSSLTFLEMTCVHTDEPWRKPNPRPSEGTDYLFPKPLKHIKIVQRSSKNFPDDPFVTHVITALPKSLESFKWLPEYSGFELLSKDIAALPRGLKSLKSRFSPKCLLNLPPALETLHIRHLRHNDYWFKDGNIPIGHLPSTLKHLTIPRIKEDDVLSLPCRFSLQSLDTCFLSDATLQLLPSLIHFTTSSTLKTQLQIFI